MLGRAVARARGCRGSNTMWLFVGILIGGSFVLLSEWNTTQHLINPPHIRVPGSPGPPTSHPPPAPAPAPSPSPSPSPFPVDPFPSHTRNITRTLEWIARHDTTPGHLQDGSSGIVVTFVTMGFLDMTLNWLCHLRAINLHSYLIIAMDPESFHAIRQWEHTAYIYLWTPQINLMDPKTMTHDHEPNIGAPNPSGLSTQAPLEMNYNEGNFVDLMIRRLRFSIDMIKLWHYPIIFVDTDIVFLHDILPSFTQASGQVVAQRDAQVMCAGQIMFRPTDMVLAMLEDVLLDTINKVQPNEQDALNALLKRGDKPYQQHVTTTYLSHDEFPSGNHFWTGSVATFERIYMNGWFPASIHNNWIMTKKAKVARFQEYGLWQPYDVIRGTCLFDQYPKDMPLKPRLNIHILAYKRVNSIKRLLDSLSSAHYDSARIDVYCHVDVPIDSNDIVTMGLVRQVATYFNDTWKWSHGHKILKLRDKHVGQNTQYYELWDPPMTNDEVIIVLQDDEVVSPYWYTWLRTAIDKYYGTDPYMYGISLQRQYFVPGPKGSGPHLPPDPRFPTPDVNGVRWKRDNTPLLYQQLGTWGQVFFPTAYRLFLSYTNTHRQHAQQHHHGNGYPMDPQFANLVSNNWFMEERKKFTKNDKLRFDDINWEYWFMGMTAEYGLYTVYTDFDNERALLVNMQEAGDHYTEDAGADAKLMTSEYWQPEKHMSFPDLSQQPVYDFWMKPVISRAQLAIRKFAMHKYWKRNDNIIPTLPIYDTTT